MHVHQHFIGGEIQPVFTCFIHSSHEISDQGQALLFIFVTLLKTEPADKNLNPITANTVKNGKRERGIEPIGLR